MHFIVSRRHGNRFAVQGVDLEHLMDFRWTFLWTSHEIDGPRQRVTTTLLRSDRNFFQLREISRSKYFWAITKNIQYLGGQSWGCIIISAPLMCIQQSG